MKRDQLRALERFSAGFIVVHRLGTVKKAAMKATKIPNGTASPGLAKARHKVMMDPRNNPAVVI
jgi:hypothetical protein